MSLQSQNAVCGHMETDDAPCNCRVKPPKCPHCGTRFMEPGHDCVTGSDYYDAMPMRQGGQASDPCTCYKDDNGTRTCRSCRDALHIERDPLAWMDEVGHTNERTKHEKEWIAVMRKRFSDAGGSGTGDYCMWLEERLYGLVGGADVNPR